MYQSRSLASILIFVLSIMLLAGLGWGDYHIASSNLAGAGFSIQYIGIQSLVKTGTSPYNNQVTTQIRTSVPREDAFTGGTSPRYTSPIFSGLVVFPFTFLDNKTLSQAIWMSVQLILIFAMLLLSVKINAWKPSWYCFTLFAVFTLLSYHVVKPWLDGGLSIWAAFFLVLVLIMINSDRNELSGAFLALASIQPQMVLLPLLFILIWAFSKKKYVLILWFLITLILMSVIGIFLVQDWIIQYIRILYNFSNNFPAGSPGTFFSHTSPGLVRQLSWLVTGLCILILIVEWLVALRKDFRWFLWTICLTMVISQWIGIPTMPGNFIELILPIVLVCALLTERWPRGGQWVAVIFAGVAFIWEWGLFYLDITSAQPDWQLNLIFPLPAILIFGLYWVRWWAIKPRRLLIEELRLRESY